MVVEIIGYIGSALVVTSMLMSSIVRLRIINTIGSVISCTYALIVGAYPLALMNACLIVINLYNLYKLIRTKKPYDTIVCGTDDSMVQYLLGYHKDDIKSFFPDFDQEKISGETAYLVLCESNPAGLLIGVQDGETFDVDIDYAAPAYRDFTVSKYLCTVLPGHGIRAMRFSHSLSGEHEEYLRRMGFVSEGGSWVLRMEA